MDTQVLVQGTMLVRAGIDAVRTILGWLPKRKSSREEIPVYRLITRHELLMARSNVATDITEMRWPR